MTSGSLLCPRPEESLGSQELFNKDCVEKASLTFDTPPNDEAYIGAYCVVLSINSILNHQWTGSENLFELLIDQI